MIILLRPCLLHGSQAEKAEEEMEVRGGGQAFEDARTVKEHDYPSDDDEKDAKRHHSSQTSHVPAESKVPPCPPPSVHSASCIHDPRE